MKSVCFGSLLLAAPLSLLLLAGCASPRVHFYSLHPPDRIETVDSGAKASIVIAPLSIPAVVDRPKLVMLESDYEVIVNEQQRWGAPLKDQLVELLAAALTDRMKTRQFVSASSAAINMPVARLSVDFVRLEFSRGDGVHVVAHWVCRAARDESVLVEGTVASHMLPGPNGYPAYVDALRRAGIAVANGIAEVLLARPDVL
jgi:uncharacterized protein